MYSGTACMQVARPSSSGSWCAAILFFALLIALLCWLCSTPKRTPHRRHGSLPQLLLDEDVKVYGEHMPGHAGCQEQKPAPLRGRGVINGATVPLDVAAPDVASIGGLNLPGSAAAGTALAGAFELTEPGKEYVAAYNPTGLASVMPAGWRSDAANPAKCASTGDGSYAEFSRYSISPEAVARSENMRSVLRLSENTRQGLGRSLGYQSLLRNYVTPVGPQPIGDKSMLFNDSSVRQSYIAAVQGSFPSLGLC